MLKPIPKGHAHDKKTGFFGPFFNWFNRGLGSGTKAYEGLLGKLLKRTVVMLGVYGAIVAGAALIYTRLPYILPADGRPRLHDNDGAAAAGRHARTHRSRVGAGRAISAETA